MRPDNPTTESDYMQDYWFDMTENPDGSKLLVTYAYGGFEIDRREGTSSDSWTDLMTAALPAIQADVDKFGVIN